MATITDNAAHAATIRQRQLIGTRIRQARKRLALTQQQLADLVGVYREQIVDWEAAKRGPSALHLERLAEALGEPLHYFYGGPSAHSLPFRDGDGSIASFLDCDPAA